MPVTARTVRALLARLNRHREQQGETPLSHARIGKATSLAKSTVSALLAGSYRAKSRDAHLARIHDYLAGLALSTGVPVPPSGRPSTPAPRSRDPTPKKRRRSTGLSLRSAGLPRLVLLLQEHQITVARLAWCIGRTKGNLHYSICTGTTSHEIINDIEAVLREAQIPIPPDLWVTADGKDLAVARRRLRSLRTGQVLAPLYAAQLSTQSRKQHLTTFLEATVQPLSHAALLHFGLTADPFRDEVRSRSDIFWTKEHQTILGVIEQAARRQSFVAVIGQVGAGKTLMKKEVCYRLPDSIRVIEPQFPDKAIITPNNLLDAILYEVAAAAGQNCRVPAHRERKARLVREALEALEQQGQTAVLILDEAHGYSRECLRSLKRLHEMERGFARLLGIVLLGQPELMDRLRDATVREVSQRCAVTEMRGLNGATPDYLRHKLERAGGHLENIFDPTGLQAIEELCTEGEGKDRRGPFPLLLNCVASLALNKAAELGEPKVTAAIIDRLTPKGTR